MITERRVLVCLLCCVVSVSSAALARENVETTAHFVFYSDLSTNLHDALIVAGRARIDSQPELFTQGEAMSCFDALPGSMREGWNLAVDYYSRIISTAGWSDRQQFLIRLDLLGSAPDDERARQYLEISTHFRNAAIPAYRDCYWSTQHARNMDWLNALLPRLNRHEAAIAARIETLYGIAWHGLPIVVDIVPVALPYGANSILLSPDGGHVLISSGDKLQGDTALEIIFHEASHTIAAGFREHPLPESLKQAAAAEGVEIPRDLWHVLLFVMTGEAVRGVLEQAGQPGYVPYIEQFDLWSGRWGAVREAVNATWPAYMAGQGSLQQAATELVRRLAEDRVPDSDQGD